MMRVPSGRTRKLPIAALGSEPAYCHETVALLAIEPPSPAHAPPSNTGVPASLAPPSTGASVPVYGPMVTS